MITRYILFSILLFAIAGPALAHQKLQDSSGRNVSDSTVLDKAKRDVQLLKHHIEISEQQEEEIRQIFENRHDFLANPHTSQGRKELVLGTHKKSLEKVLNPEQYRKLVIDGILDFWFVVRQ